VVLADAGLSVVCFCDLLGMPRASWYRWRAAIGADRPWPAPVVDRIEPLAAKHAEQWAAWGHREIWGLLAADGVAASPSSVRRALAAADCCSRSATRPSAANSPRHAGRCSPTRRPDATACGRPTCCELESLAGGIWRMNGMVEDWVKTCLACPVTTTQGTRDAVAAIEAAIDQAETLLGHPLLQDWVARRSLARVILSAA
jgi:hypothetical protein